MQITIKDLELLIRIENLLGIEVFKDKEKVYKVGTQEIDYNTLLDLINLVEKLTKAREIRNNKTRILVSEKRKIDKNYGRKKVS